jgi:RES domain-containing protein
LEITNLPANWQDVSAAPVLQKLGLKWLKEIEYPILKVPSAIIPVEYNYLVNPEHPGLKLQTEQILEFRFVGVASPLENRRMWKQVE